MIEQRLCQHHGLTRFKKRSDNAFRCMACAVESVSKRRRQLKIKSIEYKGGFCINCVYNTSVAALEFHHLDPNEKDFGIASSGNTQSWEKVKTELDKCILVCSNCHREIHENC